MDKDINDYKYGDLLDDIKLKSFIQHSTPAEIDISAIKKRAFLKMHQQERKSRQRRIMMYVGSVAATLLLLIGIKYIIGENTTDGLYRAEVMEMMADVYDEEVEVPVGEKMTLMLADGTRIIANSRTVVRYPKRFNGEYREVYVKGEAYFDVAHDAEHPFLVNSDNFRVKVLGTKFNVTAYESEAIRSVVLAQGCVQVETARTPKAILAPNQMFSSADGKENISQVDVEQAISWINGLYCFQSADLGIVLQRLSTYYGVNVEFDPALSKIKCSGKIDLKDNFETVINGLTFVAPISYAYDEQYKTYRVVKK